MTMTSVRVLQGHKGPVRDIKVSSGTPTINLLVTVMLVLHHI
jgi:hypothetical protein